MRRSRRVVNSWRRQAPHKWQRRRSTIMFIIITILTGIAINYIWQCYTDRPVIYYKVQAKETFSPQSNLSCLILLIRNTSPKAVWVNVTILVQSLTRQSLDWSFQLFHVTYIRMSLLLFGGERNFTVVPIQIYLPIMPEAFSIFVTVKLSGYFDGIIGEIHPLSPSTFIYEREDENRYILKHED